MQSVLFLSLCFFFLSANDAYAYLDPGTGSMIFQMIVGLFLAASMFIKMNWLRLKAFFSRREAQAPNEIQAPINTLTNDTPTPKP